jgi:hypothetical protein
MTINKFLIIIIITPQYKIKIPLYKIPLNLHLSKIKSEKVLKKKYYPLTPIKIILKLLLKNAKILL